MLSARLDDGRLLAVAALRPAGADGHGEELVAGALGDLEAFEQLERDAALDRVRRPTGMPRRVGLELYRVRGHRCRSGSRAMRPPRPTSTPAACAARARRSPCARRGVGRRRGARHPARRREDLADQAVISDFGGVLTTPLMNSFAAFQDRTGISAESLGRAMQAIAERDGDHPLFALETGRMTEADFLERVGDALEPELGHRPEMHSFSEIYFEALEPNEPMIELMREVRRSGHRMALLTNNVREWEHLWRSMLPVDEIFELVDRLGLRRHAQARPGDLRADARPARAGSTPRIACSSTTCSSTSKRRRRSG